MNRFLYLTIVCISLSANSVFAQKKPEYYSNQDVAKARFGDKETQALINNVMDLEDHINQRIIGQEAAARAIGTKLVQYIDGFGTRKGKPPVAQHFIGFPGIGKSGIADILSKFLPVVRIDAQRYTTPESASELGWFLERNRELRAKKPVVLLIEEIDKLREIVPGEPAITSPFIGALNQLLNDGNVTINSTIDLSHVFVVSTMNLPTEIIEEFSKEILTTDKSFYEYEIDDFTKFHSWLVSTKGSVSKVLSKLFRTNTVGRLAPNVLFMKHLSKPDYKEIIRVTIDSAIKAQTEGVKLGRKVEVAYEKSVIDFFFKNTVNPSLGARETIIKVNDMIEQIVSFGMRSYAIDRKSLDRPRKLLLSVKDLAVVIDITTQKRLNRNTLVDDASFRVTSKFDILSSTFIRPKEVNFQAPASTNRVKPLSKTDIINTRFIKKKDSAKGLTKLIAKEVFGQEIFSAHIEEEMERYLSSKGGSLREPQSSLLAGFPGIGKSAMVEIISKLLNLPIARVNLQSFSSSSDSSTINFLDTLQEEIERAKDKAGPNGKFIVLLEEIDKIGEIDSMGNPKDRPIITVVKDLIDHGTASATTKEGYSTAKRYIDVRDAYVFSTMNFDGKIFDFKADPRLTTVNDMIKAWEKIQFSKASLKNVLEKMFRPDTISRFLPRMHIIRPLEAKHYRAVIDAQKDKVIIERFFDREGKNKGQVKLKLNKSYRDFLYGEAVIPSEGARYTVDTSRRLISTHMENALVKLPRAMRGMPIFIELKFNPGKSMIIASVMTQDNKDVYKEIYRAPVELMFPDPRAFGKIPARRVLTAAHEFGHAFAAIRLGLRIELVSVISPEPGVGGFVKFAGRIHSAKELISAVYATLASRALERIVLSDNPKESRSVLDITMGPSSDIEQATSNLYQAMYRLGFDPHGGTVDSQGGLPDRGRKQSDFSALPHESVLRLGEIMRAMENFLVVDLLKANDMDWYREKILGVAKKGILNELEFYELLGFKPPGLSSSSGLISKRMDVMFPGAIATNENSIDQAGDLSLGEMKDLGASENLDTYISEFESILERLPPANRNAGPLSCKLALKGP